MIDSQLGHVEPEEKRPLSYWLARWHTRGYSDTEKRLVVDAAAIAASALEARVEALEGRRHVWDGGMLQLDDLAARVHRLANPNSPVVTPAPAKEVWHLVPAFPNSNTKAGWEPCRGIDSMCMNWAHRGSKPPEAGKRWTLHGEDPHREVCHNETSHCEDCFQEKVHGRDALRTVVVPAALLDAANDRALAEEQERIRADKQVERDGKAIGELHDECNRLRDKLAREEAAYANNIDTMADKLARAALAPAADAGKEQE